MSGAFYSLRQRYTRTPQKAANSIVPPFGKGGEGDSTREVYSDSKNPPRSPSPRPEEGRGKGIPPITNHRNWPEFPDLVLHRTRADDDSIACKRTPPMPTLTIRNLDEETKSLLRAQAARHGCSMAQEVRDILRRAMQPTPAEGDFAQRIQNRFAGLEVEDLPIPKRRSARLPESAKR